MFFKSQALSFCERHSLPLPNVLLELSAVLNYFLINIIIFEQSFGDGIDQCLLFLWFVKFIVCDWYVSFGGLNYIFIIFKN